MFLQSGPHICNCQLYRKTKGNPLSFSPSSRWSQLRSIDLSAQGKEIKRREEVFFFFLVHMSMYRSSNLLSLTSPTRLRESFQRFSIIPTSLALITSLFILFYISLTSSLFHHPHHTPLLLLHAASKSHPPARQFIRSSPQTTSVFDSQRPQSPALGKAPPFSGNGGVQARNDPYLLTQNRTGSNGMWVFFF